MAPQKESLDISQLKTYLLPGLVFSFGLQLMRSFIPGLAWYLKDTVGAGTLDLIPYAFGTFFLGFLAPILRRLLGERSALWISAGGLAILRLAEQLSRSPGLDFWLAIAGLGFFLNFISLYIGQSRRMGGTSYQRWAYGLVLGFAFDTSLRGLFGARDLSTVAGILPVFLIGLMACLVFWALWQEPQPSTDGNSDDRGKTSVLLLALGPYFTLQLLYLQSQGWVEELAGLAYPVGFLIVMLGYLAGTSGLFLGFARPQKFHPLLSALLSIYLVSAAFTADQSGMMSVVLILAGQFFLGWGLAAICSANSQGNQPGLWRTTLSVNGGMVLFLILSFAFYAALDLSLPIPRQSFPALAAALFGVLVIFGSIQVRGKPDSPWNYTGLGASLCLLLVPLLYWISLGKAPGPDQPTGYPIKVMTYNIHSAFNAAGGQDLEAIAAVIESSGADIIGLQEVSRVRLMDGAADMPIWLSRRLGMELLFQGTEEPTWGNALLTRYPILESGWGELPREGTLIGRGYLWAKIDVGENEPLLVIVTHLHQLDEDSQVRQAQVPVILEFWGEQGSTLLLGDFNAEPGWAEMEMITKAGLLDSWSEAGEGTGYTWSVVDPHRRIDWIWHSPDLKVTKIDVIQTQASDHMPVLVKLEEQE